MSARRYREIPPPSGLAPWLEALWIFRTGTLGDDAPAHVIVPDGAVSITLFLAPGSAARVGLTGPSCRAHRVQLVSGALYGGIRLRPGTAGSVLKTDVRALRDMVGPPAALAPALESVRQIFARLTEGSGTDENAIKAVLIQAARALAGAAGPVDGPVRDFATAIMQAGGNVRLGGLTADAGPGPRQLRRRFLWQCGLSPKEFARLRRVRETCIALLETGNTRQMAEAALTGGFSDQAHMSREFREVFRNSASLVRAYLRQIEHAGVAGKA